MFTAVPAVLWRQDERTCPAESDATRRGTSSDERQHVPETNGTRIQLAPEDAQRAARLTEEIRGRLEELACIVARVTGRRLGGEAIRKFVPRERGASDDPTVVDVEILDGFLDPPHAACCLVTLSNEDWFVECPCGAAG
jgi:hypothetical protein